MLMELNYQAAVQKKTTIDTEKYITHLLNYCASHPDSVTKYKINNTILHICSDASYLSEPEAQSISGGYFSLGPQQKKITDLDNSAGK